MSLRRRRRRRIISIFEDSIINFKIKKFSTNAELISIWFLKWVNYCTIDIIFTNEIRRLNDSPSCFQGWNNFLVAYLIQIYKNSVFTKSFYSNGIQRGTEFLIHEIFIQINFRLDAVTPMSACIRDVASLKFKVLQRRIWTKEPRHTRSNMYIHTRRDVRSKIIANFFFFFSFFNPFMCHDEPRLKNLRNFCYLFRITFMENINI